MSRKELPPKVEIVIGASILAALALFLLLGLLGGFTSGDFGAWLNYYGHAFSGSLLDFLYVAVLFLCILIIMLVIWSLGKSFLLEFFPKLRDRKNKKEMAAKKTYSETPLDVFLAAAKRSLEVVLIIPAILFVTIAALTMGEANEFARARLQDVMVIGWEHALFGNYVFAALGGIRYPHWLITFIIFSFENMALVLVVAGIIAAYLAVERFREMLVAFCIGILLMIPIWLMLPVLSPQDRFINNVYGLPVPPPIAAAVANYHPQSEISDFLQNVRDGKEGLPALPTSTFPSAHVFWAAIAGYYLFRTRRWLGWIALPFLTASTYGTILLAQHYFMDVPAGIAIAAIAIWLAHGIEAV